MTTASNRPVIEVPVLIVGGGGLVYGVATPMNNLRRIRGRITRRGRHVST